jgi:hypothetical protein
MTPESEMRRALMFGEAMDVIAFGRSPLRGSGFRPSDRAACCTASRRPSAASIPNAGENDNG